MNDPVVNVPQEQDVGPNPNMIRIHVQCELYFGEMKIDQPINQHIPFKFLANHLQQMMSNQYNQSSEYFYEINGKVIKSQETLELIELGIKDGDSLVMKKKP